MTNIISPVSTMLTFSVSICYFTQKYLIPSNKTMFCSINDFFGVIFKKNLNRTSKLEFVYLNYFRVICFLKPKFLEQKSRL